ncbi:MAG: T9SS type A sorting domain-containing protein [Aquirufa sp.]
MKKFFLLEHTHSLGSNRHKYAKILSTLFLSLFLLNTTLANEYVVFNKVVYSSSYTSSKINNVQNLSGSNFKFISSGATFTSTGGNVSGTFEYFNASNTKVSIAGAIEGKTKNGGTTSFLFVPTSGTTRYLLVIPGKESDADFVTDADPGVDSSPPATDLNSLKSTQSAASTTTTSASVVVNMADPAAVTESNSNYIVFTLTFSTSRSASSSTVSFTPTLTDVSTTSDSDYNSTFEYSTTSSTSGYSTVSGAISVAYTTNTIYLRVALKDDVLPESAETFVLKTGAFSGAGNGELSNGSTGANAIGTINDDGDPTLWTGAVSTDWNNAGNWNSNAAPSSTTDVKVVAGASNNLALSSNMSVKNLEVASGLTLNTAGNTITVNGNLINNGTINSTGLTGKVSMSGSSAQTITGYGNIDNLEINNSSGVSINSDSTIINRALFPVAGVLTTNGRLVMNSTSSGTAGVFQKTGTCTTYLSGTVKLRRYIDPNNNATYRLIGNPFSDINKTFSSFSGLPLTYAYQYNNAFANPDPNSATGDPAWSKVIGSNVFDTQKGIITYVNAGTPFRIEASGNLNQCDVAINFSAYSNSDANKGFVLLSNPYMAYLDLSQNTNRSNLQNGFYIWDTGADVTDANSQKTKQSGYNAKGKYKTVVPGGSNDATIIPPLGAFFVKVGVGAGSQNGSITFKESEKSNSNNVSYYTPFSSKSGSKNPTMGKTLNNNLVPIYQLKLSNNGKEIDDFKLVFRDEASNNYDNWDLTKMANSNIDLYSKIPESNYNFAVDTRSKTFDAFEIPIYLSSKVNIATESFELSWNQQSEIDAEFQLEDLISKEKIKLSNGKTYSFQAGNFSSSSPRFKIIVLNKGYNDFTDINVFPNPIESLVNIDAKGNLEGTCQVEIFDSNGVFVLSKALNFSTDKIPNINLEELKSGIYYMKAKNNQTGIVYSKKLIKK